MAIHWPGQLHVRVRVRSCYYFYITCENNNRALPMPRAWQRQTTERQLNKHKCESADSDWVSEAGHRNLPSHMLRRSLPLHMHLSRSLFVFVPGQQGEADSRTHLPGVCAFFRATFTDRKRKLNA